MTKAAILHETLHIGCKCHGQSGRGKQRKAIPKISIKKEFVPKKKYSKRDRAKTSIRHIGSRTDPLSWLTPLPEMKKVETQADKIKNMNFRKNGITGGRRMF
tara:strand:- start:212 stop:517 length:306 start_codon:yes stop_codon:yes gene_type:complete